MKGRKQKTEQDTLPQKNRAALEGYEGGQTFIWIAEKNSTDNTVEKYGLLEFILSPSNLNRACKQVKANKVVGGVYKMEFPS
jgi:hypothetical protein